MNVPQGWSEAALGDVCRIISGATPKTGESLFWGGDVRWLTPNDLSKDRSQTLSGGERSLTTAGYLSCSARTFPAGSVIVSSRAPVGYVAIAGAEMCTNQGCKTAVPPEFIDSKYLYWYLLAAKPDLNARASGTTFKEISSKRFAETRFHWPPLDEQRRIVDLLEDHLSRLDAAVDSLRRALRRADAMVVSSLAAQVTGKRECWSSSTVGAQAEVIQYGSGAKCDARATETDVPVLRMGNIKDGALVWGSLKYLPADHDDFPKLLLQPGDLLFNRTNSAEHVGKAAVFDSDCVASFASYLIRVRFHTEVLPAWANMVINSPMGREYVGSVVSQQVGQANVNGTKLKAFPLPLPTRDEQDRRIKEHSEVLASRARLRSTGDAAISRAAGLRRSLLAAAFSGRLTGAGPDWSEPPEMISA